MLDLTFLNGIERVQLADDISLVVKTYFLKVLSQALSLTLAFDVKSQLVCSFFANTVICAVNFYFFEELKQNSNAELKITKLFDLVEISSESRESGTCMCQPKILVPPCPVDGSRKRLCT